MFAIEIKIPPVKIVMQNTNAQNFCRYVLVSYFNSATKPTLPCYGAYYLYNKLRNKTNQQKITIKLPVEYAILLKDFCSNTAVEHDLDRICLYDIYEQLDKKLKF